MCPSWARIASRRSASWRARALFIASGKSSQRRVGTLEIGEEKRHRSRGALVHAREGRPHAFGAPAQRSREAPAIHRSVDRVTVGACPGPKSMDCRSRTRSSAKGRPWIVTPGGRFSKDYRGSASSPRRSGGAGQPRGHLGPPELRGVRGVLPRRVGVGDAGRRAGRASAPARPRAGGDRRRLGRRSRVAARREPPPRPRGGLGVWWISGGVFGLLGLAKYYCAPSVPAAWNRGMEAVVDLPSWKEVVERHPREPRRILGAGPAGVHRDDGAMDAGVLRLRRRAGPGHARPRRPRGSTPGARVPQRCVRLQPPPRDVGAGRGAAPDRPARRAAVARHRVDRPGARACGRVRALAAPRAQLWSGRTRR